LFRKTSPIPTVLCVPLALLATAALRAVILMPASAAEFAFRADYLGMEDYAAELMDGPAAALHLAGPAMNALSATLLVCGGLWGAASLVGMVVRRPWAMALLRAAYVAVFVASVVFAHVVFLAAGALSDTVKEASREVEGLELDVFKLQWHYLRWALLAGAFAAGMLLLSWRGKAMALFNMAAPSGPGAGDRVLEGIRTGGRDPCYRKSWLSSAFVHWFLIIALPFLLLFRGCIEPYLVPHGRGQARVTRVMRVVRRKKKERKKYILRRNAAVYWDIPDLSESDIARQVDEDTQLTWQTDLNALHGKMGAGGGKKGGWPDGVPGGKIRFIRLEYRGRNWDDGMDAHSQADINFLAFLRQEVPFPVARKSESHRISLLTRYPKGFAPPFVYMTGSSSVGASSTERRVLRDYLLDGGMLFADAGSWQWDRSFRSFIKGVFPDKRLIDIADDDELYQMPYVFADGAPPLWHHGGFRAMGIKHKGRWCVFYHPGDVNDAWKTGHSGMDPEIADRAFQMGINVMYYSITKYLQLTKKYRKR
jgi:hypothetical protein